MAVARTLKPARVLYAILYLGPVESEG